jgi:hypothetical protein
VNKLLLEKRVQIISMLGADSTLPSISRVVGVSINTVTKVVVGAGETCLALGDELARDVKASKVQCDAIWSFCYAKENWDTRTCPRRRSGVTAEPRGTL